MCATTRRRSPSCFRRCGISRKDLRAAGWTVDYVTLDDPANSGSFEGEVARAVARHGATRIVTTEAGEWRVHARARSAGAP